MTLKIIPVEPIGKRMLAAHVNTSIGNEHIWGEIEVDVFPKNKDAKEFQNLRRNDLRISLGEAATRLGITVTQLSGMEHGMYTCDWEEAVELLMAGEKKKDENV